MSAPYSTYRITIANCNNIVSGRLTIVKNALNVKYGLNGTGKTTICKALALRHEEDGLQKLRPFGSDANVSPKVSGGPSRGKVLFFGEEYVQRFVFAKNELMRNSFDVFIIPQDYADRIKEIEELLSEVREVFNPNSPVSQLMELMGRFVDGFGTAKGGFSRTGSIAKGMAKGNRIDNIPNHLECYAGFLSRKDLAVDWVKWIAEGHKFQSGIEICAFCGKPFPEADGQISSIEQIYPANMIKHYFLMREVFDSIKGNFSSDVQSRIDSIINQGVDFSKEDISFLVAIRNDVELLLNKLRRAQSLGFVPSGNHNAIREELKSCQIVLRDTSYCDTQPFRTILAPLMGRLKNLQANSNRLQVAMGRLRTKVISTINRNKEQINTFLMQTGYRYRIDVGEDRKSLVLKYDEKIVLDARAHLSYGERNALALALFKYEAMHEKPNLVVLDDPISSFDGEKRFGLIDFLFFGDATTCLKRHTVLLLTHDFVPVVDIIKTHYRHFETPPQAWFVSNVNGILQEKRIRRDDIRSVLDIMRTNRRRAVDGLIKLIYLRREVEILDGKGLVYIVISNLLHGREKPQKGRSANARLISNAQLRKAERLIREYVPTYCYKSLLEMVLDRTRMCALYDACKSNYEKLQVFRMIFEGRRGVLDQITQKFVNEVYHVENESLFQLNPCKYATVPDYVVQQLDRRVECEKHQLTQLQEVCNEIED